MFIASLLSHPLIGSISWKFSAWLFMTYVIVSLQYSVDNHVTNLWPHCVWPQNCNRSTILLTCLRMISHGKSPEQLRIICNISCISTILFCCHGSADVACITVQFHYFNSNDDRGKYSGRLHSPPFQGRGWIRYSDIGERSWGWLFFRVSLHYFLATSLLIT